MQEWCDWQALRTWDALVEHATADGAYQEALDHLRPPCLRQASCPVRPRWRALRAGPQKNTGGHCSYPIEQWGTGTLRMRKLYSSYTLFLHAVRAERLRFLIAHRPGFVAPTLAARKAATPYGHTPRFSVSVRPILGHSEAQAWERARTILAQLPRQNRAALRQQAVGSRRLLDFAAQGEVHDRRLWMPIAAATSAAGNTTALVSTPEQVAESLLDYYDAGATTLLIRGFDPIHDAREFGRELILLVRAEVARHHTAVAREETL